MQLCSIDEIQLKKKILIDKPKKKNIENQKNETDDSDKLLKKKVDKSHTNVTKEPEKVDKSHTNETKEPENSREDSTPPKSNKLPNSSKIISITDELTESITLNENENVQNSNAIWSEEQMLDLWKQFASKLKQKKKINAHNIFNRHFPQKENNSIILEVVSLSEKTEIEDFQIELLHFFKKGLQNDYISLLIQVSLNNQKNTLYTKEDKYKYILDKNEKIQLLQKKLNLTIN